jgi:hypothetical protein
MPFANRIGSSTSCSIWLPETSPPSSSRSLRRHRFQSCNTSTATVQSTLEGTSRPTAADSDRRRTLRARAICTRAWTRRASPAALFLRIRRNLSGREIGRSIGKASGIGAGSDRPCNPEIAAKLATASASPKSTFANRLELVRA